MDVRKFRKFRKYYDTLRVNVAVTVMVTNVTTVTVNGNIYMFLSQKFRQKVVKKDPKMH